MLNAYHYHDNKPYHLTLTGRLILKKVVAITHVISFRLSTNFENVRKYVLLIVDNAIKLFRVDEFDSNITSWHQAMNVLCQH